MCICVKARACVHVCVCMCVNAHACVHAGAWVCVCMCVSAGAWVCVCVQVHVCTRVCVKRGFSGWSIRRAGSAEPPGCCVTMWCPEWGMAKLVILRFPPVCFHLTGAFTSERPPPPARRPRPSPSHVCTRSQRLGAQSPLPPAPSGLGPRRQVPLAHGSPRHLAALASAAARAQSPLRPCRWDAAW